MRPHVTGYTSCNMNPQCGWHDPSFPGGLHRTTVTWYEHYTSRDVTSHYRLHNIPSYTYHSQKRAQTDSFIWQSIVRIVRYQVHPYCRPFEVGLSPPFSSITIEVNTSLPSCLTSLTCTSSQLPLPSLTNTTVEVDLSPLPPSPAVEQVLLVKVVQLVQQLMGHGATCLIQVRPKKGHTQHLHTNNNVWLYTHRQTDTQTDRHTDWQTDKQWWRGTLNRSP